MNELELAVFSASKVAGGFPPGRAAKHSLKKAKTVQNLAVTEIDG